MPPGPASRRADRCEHWGHQVHIYLEEGGGFGLPRGAPPLAAQPRQKASLSHPASLLAPAAALIAHPARAFLATTQGAQISLGALLMTVVGGGSPGVAAANPGLSKWLNGAIGLPVVRGCPVQA